MTKEQIEHAFTYHPPKKDQIERYVEVRQRAKELAHYINESCADSREKSLAITHLEETVMWANAAIARNE